MSSPCDVLDFWFGGVSRSDGDDAAGSENPFQRWFGGADAFDAEIRERFGALIDTALEGGLADWEDDVPSRLALILLLDQFPRNVFRRTARAFAGDERALGLARRTVANGEDERLAPAERFFLLMPYQHAEDRDTQAEGVRLFEELAALAVPGPLKKMLASGLEYARKHCDIIARFGRFPYRNAVLGRETTAEEEKWLTESGERFGQ
ncbi:MAG TPA: DUF924 family protein [Gammaproteobacteria bacterium]